MPDIEKHLHQLSNLLREQDSIKLVVRLESSAVSRIRYLAVVSCTEQDAAEEYCLLGIDCDASISLGLVLAILSYTTIRLDGDGYVALVEEREEGVGSSWVVGIHVIRLLFFLQRVLRHDWRRFAQPYIQASVRPNDVVRLTILVSS
jgi:hypothetical protein